MPKAPRIDSSCLPSYATGEGASGDIGFGPTHVAKTELGTTAKTEEVARDAALERAERMQLINDSIVEANARFFGDSVPKTDKIKAQNEFEKKLTDYQKEAAPLREQAFRDMIDLANSTTVGTESWWSNAKNKVYGLFVNARSELIKWLAHYMGDGGVLEPYKYRIIQLFERIEPTERAFRYKFMQRREALLDKFNDAFNRVGISREEGAYALGVYATARHAPERNAMLLARWKSMVAEAERKKSSTVSDGTSVGEYKRRIKLLEDNLETVNPEFEAGDASRFLSSGYTNAEARAVMDDIIKRTGFTKEEADAFSDALTEEFNYIMLERGRNGTLERNLRLPKFQYYVPMLSKKSDNMGNYTGAGNDATPYNPGNYYAALGRGTPPDSAWSTLGFYGDRAAAEIATRDFGFALYAIEQRLKRTEDQRWGRNSTGLRSIDYGDLMRQMHSGGPMREAFHQMYNNGGFVALIPKEDGTFDRRFFWFSGPNFSHNGANFDIVKLNQGLSASFKTAPTGPVIGAMASATSFMGQLPTRYTPGFAPISGTRDFVERGLNMMNRTYETESGETTGGWELASKFVGNIFTAGSLLRQGMRGKLDPNSENGRLYQEFVDKGMAQKFTQRTLVRDNSLDNAIASIEREPSRIEEALGFNKPVFNKLKNYMGSAWNQFIRIIDGWNDYWQNLAAFDHYYTLRKSGVSADRAAAGVLQEMNMSQRGTLTPYLQALAPFITPTVQSGTAMLRSLGLGAKNPKDIIKSGWKGYATIVGAFVAYNVLMEMSKDSLGVDEHGNSRFDSLSLDEVTRALPIGYGDEGDYLRMPIGFGEAQMGAKMAVGVDRVMRGLMSPTDLMFELGFTALKNVAPGNWPQYNFTDKPMQYIMSLFTPSPLRPIQEITANYNFFGSEIYNVPRTPYQSPADMGRTSTPRPFHSTAQWVRDFVGVDMQPEVYEHGARGYMLGPLKGFVAMASQLDDIYKGSNRPSSMDDMEPWLAALGLASWTGKQANASRSLFYEARRYYADLIREQGIDLSAPRGADPELWRRTQLANAGWPQDRIEDVIHIWKAEKTLQQQGRDFNAQYKDAWDRYDTSRELKEAFDQLGDDNADVYAEAVESLNYYGGVR